MISWNQWLRLFSQPILHVFNLKKLYTNKRKRPFLEGLEERITPVNPSVSSILRNAGTTASTSASYAVSFSESVTGVDSADFTTSTSGGVASTSISVAGSGATYTVTILGITGTGSISLNLIDNDTIINSASQPLGGTNLPGISFSAKTDYSTGGSVNSPSGPHAITTGLINADGFTDIITANRFNNKISVLLGVGDGTFNTQINFNTGNTPQGITTGDINGDSKLDLVTANNFNDSNIPGNVSVFLGNGNNSFISKPVVATENGPLSIVLGDFNADTKLDIATADYGSNSISIFLGNGNGTFIAATNFATGSGPKSVAMGDVNGDGFLDLATANFTAPNSLERLSLLLGNGDGSFKAPIALTAGTKPFSVIMADVNGDGKKDLISANYNSANVSILLGNGNGTFQSATSASTGTKPVSVAAADLDGDGKIDLAVANRDSNSISLLAGNGDGTFKTAINFTTGTTPYSVTIADFNGDSKPDIATANEGSDNISVFLNTTNNPANFTGQTYTVTAPATQTSITTTAAGAPSGLAFTTQPVITIKDASGNTVTTSTAAVTMTVSSGATTVGTATVNAVAGVATFSDVGISGTSGTSYTLTFASTGLTGTDQTITPVFSSNFTVTTTANSGSGSLREAITLANTTPGDDQISFNLTGASAYTITLASALPTILNVRTAINGGTVGTLTINGLGASSLIISGLDNSSGTINISRNFNVFNIATGGNLAISGVTVSGAKVTGNNGGGIYNGGTITVFNSTISSNSTSYRGGGIYNGPSATLTVFNSTISGNSASYSGGGIYNGQSAALTVNNSTLSGNFAGQGGGIRNSGGTLTVSNSTISGNSASNLGGGSGGGIFSGGILTVSNSTISGNSANLTGSGSARGGGIYTIGTGITFTISNSTISGNSATGHSKGGGIYNRGGTLIVSNSILYGNFAGYTGAEYFNFGTTTITGNNNISSFNSEIGTGCIIADPRLGPLQDNGGSTFTMALGSGSLAINAGNATISNSSPIFGLDQRGYARSSTAPSIGAYEFNGFGTATQATLSTSAAGAPSGLAFTTQPVITIKDATGNTVITSTASVTMTVSSGGTAVGTATVNTVNGIATFTNVGISGTSETAYTLTFASSGLTSANQRITLADTAAPTITITSDKTALRIGETATITFTLSETSTNFSNADITIVGGTLGTLSGSGSSYTATFTPNINSITPATLNIGAGTFTDAVGNNNTAASQLSINIDTAAPTITITSDKNSLISGETATITFTLSEASTNFNDADITVVGGTLGTLSGSGSSYTATFTPNINSTTPATFNVAAGTFTDSVGNNNTAAAQLSINIDTLAPTIIITSDKTSLRIGATATITFTLSETSANFSDADITFVGGTLGTLSGTGSSYTATFTPANNSTTPATFNVAAGSFTDAAGNNNTAANQLSINIDTAAPTINITSSKAALKSGETATLTFTLSEGASTALISSNITVVGGALSNFAVVSGTSYTATFTPNTNSTATATFNVAANTFTDAAGNNNTASNTISITVDTLAPTIIITSSKAALKIGEAATLTFTLSETSSTALISSNITVIGGTLSNFAGSGLTYTATFTPTNNTTATATFNVLANTFTDAAGNPNTASNTISITADTTAPTITISSDKTTLRIGETATLTFTLSEASSTALISSNITMAGGTLSNFAGSGSTYTATFTPTANTTATATINVAGGTFTDAAGNPNTASNTISITVDTTAPTITISSNKTTLMIGETATLTFTLSEASSTALISSNITVIGGTLSNFAGSGTSYTATFTPTNNTTATATINVAAGTFTDSAGNPNTAATQFTITVDTVAPTIIVTSDKTTLRIGETANLTFTLSEASSTALISSNITVVGGALSNFSGSGLTYTATFTPNNNSTANATINVAAGTFTDSAGNPNTAATQLSINIDTAAPTITITSNKTSLRIGETATLTFTLSESASTAIISSNITMAGGTLGTLSGSGSSYTATFTPTANSTATATFNVAAATFTDGVGNNNTAAPQLSINIDTAAPTITITSDKTILRIGETSTLTFTLSENSSDFTVGDITTVGGLLSSFAGTGSSYTATFTPTNNRTAPATINVLANTFTDGAGNDNTAATQLSINIDTAAPTITITSSKAALKIGETATLTFTLSEAASTALISSNITVDGGTLSNFVGSGLTYTATFDPTNNRTTPATINVLANTFTDAVGNNNTAATQISITVDTVAPTITIASNKTSLRIGETASLTFTLSEAASTALISSNITVVGGALSSFSGSGTSYTATFTPTANSTTTATFNVAAGTFTDGAGNNNTAVTQLSINIDTAAPTITITSSKAALKIGETATLTFTLSEAASTALISSNITVVGGALSNFAGSGLTYTATFTPNNNSTTPAIINVLANTFTDAAGNNNTAATQLSITVDTVAPTITIASNKTSLRIGETASLTFTLSEAASTAFISSNITTVGGTLSGFSGSGTSYTATFTPTNNSTTPASIHILANTFTDAAGNTNTAATQLSITVDTVAPTITIASNKTSLRIGETASLTFTLSEAASTALISSNITVMGGALSSFSGSGTSYTATFTPTANSTTTATFNVLANTFTDGAGNPSIASNTISMTVDTTTPAPSPAPSPAPTPTPTPTPAPTPTPTPAPAPAPTLTPSPTPTPPRRITASSSSFIDGVSSTVNLIDQDTGNQVALVTPFPGFSGELRIAMGDMNHDGKMETIIAAGPGGGPALMVMDSETGTVIQTFFAFDPAFKGGIFVAIADFNSDEIMDIVVGAGSGGGPHIKIFDGLTQNVLRSFFAYQENFNGGVSVAAIDINEDGFAELVTGTGSGGSSHVKVFDGKTFEIVSQWYAYPSDFRGGIFVAVGDIGNDGRFEVVTGAGEGGGPVVAIWDPYTGALLNQFLAYDENFGGGARVGISDGNGDGITDLLTGAGPGGGPQVNGYSFPALDLLFSFYSGNPNNAGGVFVS